MMSSSLSSQGSIQPSYGFSRASQTSLDTTNSAVSRSETYVNLLAILKAIPSLFIALCASIIALISGGLSTRNEWLIISNSALIELGLRQTDSIHVKITSTQLCSTVNLVESGEIVSFSCRDISQPTAYRDLSYIVLTSVIVNLVACISLCLSYRHLMYFVFKLSGKPPYGLLCFASTTFAVRNHWISKFLCCGERSSENLGFIMRPSNQVFMSISSFCLYLVAITIFSLNHSVYMGNITLKRGFLLCIGAAIWNVVAFVAGFRAYMLIKDVTDLSFCHLNFTSCRCCSSDDDGSLFSPRSDIQLKIPSSMMKNRIYPENPESEFLAEGR